MGKKTEKERLKMRTNLDILMSLPVDIIQRNPQIKALYKNHVIPEESKGEFQRIVEEIYGVFPMSPFPVLDLVNKKNEPNELFLRIDLNYSKDEIMYILEKFVTNKIKEYKENHTVKTNRKHPQKWIKYLEVWDLKNGDPPWEQTGNTKMPFGVKKKGSRPWTYEEIAKYLYPDKQTPDELARAVDGAKKQYRAAYKLICGEDYNPRNRNNTIERLKGSKNKKIECDSCIERPNCKELCPPILEDLAKIYVGQQHLLVSSKVYFRQACVAVKNNNFFKAGRNSRPAKGPLQLSQSGNI
ncbi:hypothetical protein ACFL0M_00580 [Thermodesulfobacteriota bacterium]